MNADDRVLVGIAAAAAFAAGLLAVAQHSSCTSAGYELAVAQREGTELRLAASQQERRVTALSTAQAASARIAPMKLTTLRYPKTWNVVNAATVTSCAAASAAASMSVAPRAAGTPR